MTFKTRARLFLEDSLRKYRRTYLISPKFMKSMFDYFDGNHTEEVGSVLIITTGKEFDNVWFMPIRIVSSEEYYILRKLYFTYEFSDRFRLVEDTGKYGTMKNYIETGIITEEQAVRSLFSELK